MKAIINGKEHIVKCVENLGYVHSIGAYAKVVIGKTVNECVVIKAGGIWRNRNPEEKLSPASNYTPMYASNRWAMRKERTR